MSKGTNNLDRFYLPYAMYVCSLVRLKESLSLLGGPNGKIRQDLGDELIIATSKCWNSNPWELISHPVATQEFDPRRALLTPSSGVWAFLWATSSIWGVGLPLGCGRWSIVTCRSKNATLRLYDKALMNRGSMMTDTQRIYSCPVLVPFKWLEGPHRTGTAAFQRAKVRSRSRDWWFASLWITP